MVVRLQVLSVGAGTALFAIGVLNDAYSFRVAFAFAFDSMSGQRPFLRTPSVNRPMTLGSEVHMQIKTKGYSGGGSQGSSVGHLGKMTMGFLSGTSEMDTIDETNIHSEQNK